MLGSRPDSHPKPLGRRVPTTDAHIRSFPLSVPTVAAVEKVLHLPWWHWHHDQGAEGACVGHGTAMERAVREFVERKARAQRPFTMRFDPWWLWDRAKEVDEWSDTNPGDGNGTSVRAAYDIVRKYGAVKTVSLPVNVNYPGPNGPWGKPDLRWRVQVNQWARTVDEMRTCLAREQPVTIGINWYDNFDEPIKDSKGNWAIGQGDFGTVRGGHSVCIYGASDSRQAFKLKNSWGRSYPLVWLSYAAMSRLLSEDGEATVVTDGLDAIPAKQKGCLF